LTHPTPYEKSAAVRGPSRRGSLTFWSVPPARREKPGCERILNGSKTAKTKDIGGLFSEWADRRSLVQRLCGFLDARFGRVFCISARLVRPSNCGARPIVARGEPPFPEKVPMTHPPPYEKSPATRGSATPRPSPGQEVRYAAHPITAKLGRVGGPPWRSFRGARHLLYRVSVIFALPLLFSSSLVLRGML
jgi:hypothetical protein